MHVHTDTVRRIDLCGGAEVSQTALITCQAADIARVHFIYLLNLGERNDAIVISAYVARSGGRANITRGVTRCFIKRAAAVKQRHREDMTTL